jgi:GGDEF domain-containing protein
MMASIALPGPDGAIVPLSISAGATLAHPGDTAEELIRAADALMYKSKKNGGNRATTEDGPVKKSCGSTLVSINVG